MKGLWALVVVVVILLVASNVQNNFNSRFDRLEKLIVNPVSARSINDVPARNKVFSVPGTSIWYAERGSLKIPVNGFDEMFDQNLYFHEIWFQKDIGFAVGQLGSGQWLLDGMGRKISEDFFLRFSKKDGQIYGHTATQVIPVQIKQ